MRKWKYCIYNAEKWYPATVTTTVLGALVENKVFPDPCFGTNIEFVSGYIADLAGENPAFVADGWKIDPLEVNIP